MINEEPSPTVHDFGEPCDLCGGKGCATEDELAQRPGCPLGLDFCFPLGPEGLRMAQARERARRKIAGPRIKAERESLGWTQTDLAQESGISREVIAMGETRGTWGAEAFAEIEKTLALAKAAHFTLS